MRIPEFIKSSDRIGFIAPSFGCNIEPYRTAFFNAQKKLKEKGYNIELGPNCYKGDGIGISSTPQACGEEVMDFFTNRKAEAIISCGGGELMCEILDYVDFEKIKNATPPWFMGYSDNTNLTFLITTLCDIATVYGPCAAAFGMEPWHKSLEDALSILEGKKSSIKGYLMWEKESLKTPENPLVPYNVTEKRKIITYGVEDSKSEFSGRLIGGCLDCLGRLVGTEFDKVSDFAWRYREDGIIWYMEACDLNVMDIRRTIWQLKHAGWFKYVKGFLIGRPLCFGEEFLGLNQYDAVTEILKEYNVPVIMDLDIGHLAPMMPMVNGVYASVFVQNNDISINYNY